MGEPAAPLTARQGQLTRPRQAVEQPKKNPPDDKADRNATAPQLGPAAEKPWSAALPLLPEIPAVTAGRGQPFQASAPLSGEATGAIAPGSAAEPDDPRQAEAEPGGKSRSRKRPDEPAVQKSPPSPAATGDAAQPRAAGPLPVPSPAISIDDGSPAASTDAKPRVAPPSVPSLREGGGTSRVPAPARPLAAAPEAASDPVSTTSAADSTTSEAPSDAPRGELAFALRLRPAPPPELAAASAEPPAPISSPVESGRAAGPSPPARVGPRSAAISSQPAGDSPTPPAVDPAGEASQPAERRDGNPESDRQPAAREKPRGAAPEALQEAPPPDSADRSAASAAAMVRPAAEAARAPETSAGRSAVTASSKEPVPLGGSTAVPAQARPAAARDIRLEVTGGDSRVEVRVVERSGDLRVDVRTPDARLAGELREGLPALTARLEQTGFRAEAWHPPAAVQGRSQLTELRAAAATESGGQEGRWGGRGGQNDPPQPKAKNTVGSRSKEDRQRFASLMGDLK